jgi:methionyl-tRNA formyltransferase
LLPKWRGAAPVQRSIEAGERETGVTIMRIDRQLDHGPMFAKRAIEVAEDERAPSVFDRLAVAGAELLVQVVDSIEAGTATEQEQEHELATHAAKIDKEEGRVRWGEPASVIYNRFRAFDPWPGTFTELHGEMVKILEMRRAGEPKAKEPGTIDIGTEGVTVSAGDGALLLTTLQRSGKGRAPAGDVMRSLGAQNGAKFS